MKEENVFLVELKLMAPKVSDKFIIRKQFLKHICTMSESIIILQANNGYGKTTALAQYCSINPGTSAWYTLDDNDNKVSVFLMHLLRMVENAIPNCKLELKKFPEIKEKEQIEQAVRMIINEINRYMRMELSNKKLLFVFDNFHYITNPLIHHMLEQILEYMPANFKLLFSLEGSIPEIFTKYFLSGKCGCIIENMLAFTNEEIKDLMRPMTTITALNREDFEIVGRLTEGWPVAVGFLLQHLKQTRFRLRNMNEKYLLQNTMLKKYVNCEIFQKLSGDLQKFLLMTSVLQEVNLELCGLVLDLHNYQMLFEEVWERNLFIQKESHEAEHSKTAGFRYHRLFKEFLKGKIEQEDKEKSLERITRYYLEREDFDKASQYARNLDNEILSKEIQERYNMVNDKENTIINEIKESKLRVNMFGGSRVIEMNTGKEIVWRARKGRELFVYLIQLQGKPVERKTLLNQLWVEEIPSSAVAMFHNMLHDFRKKLKEFDLEKLIQYKNNKYSLDMNYINCDLDKINKLCSLVEQKNYKEVINNRAAFRNYWGRYADDIDSSWIWDRQEYYEKMYAKGCGIIANYLKKNHNYEEAIIFYRNALNLSMYSDKLVAEIIQCYGSLRDFKNVKKQFDSFCELLDKDLHIIPDKELVAMYNKIMSRTNQPLNKNRVSEITKNNSVV